MADQWFIVRDDKKYGPYTPLQMKEFAASGKLLPIDMVSPNGSEPWVPASQVPGFFESGIIPSPPLPHPTRQPASVQPHPLASAKAGELWRRVWGNKLLFFGLCLGFSLFICCPLGNLIGPLLPEKLWHSFAPLFILFNLGLFIAFLCAWMSVATAHTNRQKRRAHLHGLWEPVDREGQSFLFTKDGGMYRSDGFGAKYRWAADDKLELYEDDCEQTVQFTLLSLSELEMILKTGGQSCHFKRCDTITETEMSRRREAAFRALGNVVGGVSRVALGAAAVLAAGGFAVLCGAAAVAGADSVGGESGSSGGPSPQSPSSSQGSSTGSARTEAQVRGQQRVRQVVGVVGAVVISNGGTMVEYKKKCEYCGTMQSGSTRQAAANIGTVQSGSFMCQKCHKTQPYELRNS